MTEKGITKAALEKRIKELEKGIEPLKEENYAYHAALAPLLPIARTQVKIHKRRNTKPEAGIDIGVRFDALQRIAALDIPSSDEEAK